MFLWTKKCACLLCSCFLLFFIHLDNEDIENSVKSLHPLQDGVCCYVKLWRNIHVNYRREQLIQETATPAAAHISQHGWELRASDIGSYGLYQIPCFLFLSNNSIINISFHVMMLSIAMLAYLQHNSMPYSKSIHIGIFNMCNVQLAS